MQNYTDIEQSKKLAEILPIESADGTWKQYAICGAALDAPEEMQYIHQETPFKLYSGIGIPCWSLTALLGVLPYPSLHQTSTNWRCDITRKDGYTIEFGDYADNPIDACYEMILKLHEQKLI